MKRKTCTKRRYRTELDAKITMSRIVSKDDDNLREKKPRRAYPCPRCGGWHLTSMP